MDFTGKSVIVTGGSAGIGREIACEFARHGASVAINYSQSVKEAEETLELVRKAGGKGVLVRADVSKDEEARRLVAETVEAFGGVDILVNNAATTRFIPYPDLDSVDAEAWTRLHEVNVMGPFFCARAAAAAMPEKGGAIVNISSIAGFRNTSSSSIPYAVSKAGVHHLTRGLALALAPRVRVNSVSPGAVTETRWHEGRRREDVDKGFAAAAAGSLLKRCGVPGEIAPAVLFLASDEASFCNGADLVVDGGRMLVV